MIDKFIGKIFNPITSIEDQAVISIIFYNIIIIMIDYTCVIFNQVATTWPFVKCLLFVVSNLLQR